eukprot:6182000-Pleurochrysis_carterae.AAC.1
MHSAGMHANERVPSHSKDTVGESAKKGEEAGGGRGMGREVRHARYGGALAQTSSARRANCASLS